jgi:hypothetical protein
MRWTPRETIPWLESAILILAVVLGLVGGCAGKLPLLMTPSNCGDGCATLNCPAGMRCTFSGTCAPYCEPEPQR